jgi:hypothetical protein
MYSGTTTPLAGAATFTGITRMTNRDDNVVGTVFSDQAGTLHVEQSNDPKAADPLTSASAAWDIDTTTAVVASTGGTFTVALVAPYWRIRYVNGATPQTVIRLHAKTASSGDS